MNTDVLNLIGNFYWKGLIARFVIDEAHTVLEWGNTFRPLYKKLNNLRIKYPTIPIMALTATINEENMMNTTNLCISVVQKQNRKLTIDTIISKIKECCGSVIIFTLSCKECEQVCEDLRKAGIASEFFHGKLSDSDKKSVYHKWIECQTDVVCATCAFGMEIDKADVRLVIHNCNPRSIEQYYQEIGRAGRDGNEGVCLMFYNNADYVRQRKLI